MTVPDYPLGQAIHDLATRLWPLNRSLTGNGVRETLRVLQQELPDIAIHEVASGTRVFDWTIPNEWNVREAWIEDSQGRRIADFSENNLHLLGYSTPVDTTLGLDELQEHLYSVPEQPDAIPYVTSYYSPRWGFCLRHAERQQLTPGTYHAFVDAKLEPGSLTYGELIIPGETNQEIFLSTYVCHPSMANNELSGPCVTAFIAKWLSGLTSRRFTYRIVFIPETIGSIAYLSRNLEHLKQRVIAGFNVTCIGDDRCYSYLPSRAGNTLSDQAALHVLKHHAPNFRKYSYLDRGSDERQYCAPGVDLPIATIMRSKYCEYPEYHTSLDNLTLVTPDGLGGGYMALRKAIEAIENNCRPLAAMIGEPQLGKRGLYPTLSTKSSGIKSSGESIKSMMNLIAYSDGFHSLLDIAEIIGVPMWELVPIYENLRAHGVLLDSDMAAG